MLVLLLQLTPQKPPWEVFGARNSKSREVAMWVCGPRQSDRSQLHRGRHFASFKARPIGHAPQNTVEWMKQGWERDLRRGPRSEMDGGWNRGRERRGKRRTFRLSYLTWKCSNCKSWHTQGAVLKGKVISGLLPRAQAFRSRGKG